MATSSNGSTATVDLYVLEYVANMRWLLQYAARELDPNIEQQYAHFIAQVSKLCLHLSGKSFERRCTLEDVPLGVLRLSREATLYLLVSDHLLGGCPPTMHRFLLRAVAADVKVTSRISPRKAPLSADLNVSFPRDDDDDNEGHNIPRKNTELDLRPLAAIDLNSEGVREWVEESVQGRGTQAMLLLLRWLLIERVLASEDEIASTLDVRSSSPVSLDPHAPKVTPAVTNNEHFFRHQDFAQRLAQFTPFYVGAHLLISRSLLLQYCATLLTVDAVMQHVTHLRSFVSPSAEQHNRVSPPSSVEGALLEWFQAIVSSVNVGESESVVMQCLQTCTALSAFIQYGPFCEGVSDPADHDFFRLLQSGESVCVALIFYYPDIFPLAELSESLQTVEDRIHRQKATESTPEEMHLQQSLCYWKAIKVATRQLGVSMLLHPEEIVTFGCTALPLHLFCFTEQLFAVLATKAEEDVRVSADTATWEQLHRRGGLGKEVKREAFDARRRGQEESQLIRSVEGKISLSGAQQVLRRSMLEKISSRLWVTSEAHNGDSESENVRMDGYLSGRLKERDRRTRPTSAGHVAESFQADESQSIRTDADVPVCVEESTDEDTTQFSVRLAQTQRGDQIPLARSCEETTETNTSFLRPMIKRRWSTLTSGGAAPSTFSTISCDICTKAPSASRLNGQPSTDSRITLFGGHFVDTYVRAEETCDHSCCVGGDSDLITPAVPELSAAHPTPSDTLLHARAVEASLHTNSTVTYAGLTAMGASPIGMTVARELRTEKRSSNKEKKEVLSTDSLGKATGEDDYPSSVLQFPRGSPNKVVPTVYAVETPLPPPHGAHRVAAAALSESSVLSEKHTLAAANDSPCATTESPSPQLLEAPAGAAHPIPSGKDVLSSAVVCPPVPFFPPPSSGTRDACERYGDPDTDAAAIADGSSEKALYAMTNVGDSLVKRTSGAKRTHAFSSVTKLQKPVIVSKQTYLATFSGGVHTSRTYSCKSLSSTDVVTDDSVCPIAADQAEISVYAASSVKGLSRHQTSTGPSAPSRADPSKKTSTLISYNSVTSDSALSPSHQPRPTRVEGDAHPTILEEESDTQHTLPPCALSSSSSLQPFSMSKKSCNNNEHVMDPHTPRKTKSVGTDSRAVSPLTPVQTRSASDVYDSQYATLLEDMSASEVDILRRCHRTADEESWYSSAMRPYQHSVRSTVGSISSALSPTQNRTQVRELLDRLTKINWAELAEKDKSELNDALAEQNALVKEIEDALDAKSTRASSKGVFYRASRRPSLQRKRYVQLCSIPGKVPTFDANVVP